MTNTLLAVILFVNGLVLLAVAVLLLSQPRPAESQCRTDKAVVEWRTLVITVSEPTTITLPAATTGSLSAYSTSSGTLALATTAAEVVKPPAPYSWADSTVYHKRTTDNESAMNLAVRLGLDVDNEHVAVKDGTAYIETSSGNIYCWTMKNGTMGGIDNSAASRARYSDAKRNSFKGWQVVK